MANDVNGGTPPNEGAAQPTSGTQTSSTKQETQQNQTTQSNVDAELAAGRKAQAELKELQDYFSQRKELYDAALRYDQDPKFQDHIKSYLAGKSNGDSHAATTTSEPDLSSLDDKQKAEVQRYIENQIKTYLDPINTEVSQLRTFSAQSQIDGLRSKYTAEKGWPVSFKEKEGEIANMLNSRQAHSPESAYLQIVGSMVPQIKGDYDKRVVETKRQISMSRSTAPTTYAIKRDSDKPMTFAEAVRIAQEKVGQ